MPDKSKDRIVPPAKVHGDSEVSAVTSPTNETEAPAKPPKDGATSDPGTALPSGEQTEAGMRS